MKRALFALILFPFVAAFAQSFGGQSSSDVRTVPPYRFCVGADNGNDVCLSQTGSGQANFAGNISAKSLNNVVGVLGYGAKCDGSTDDTTAFTNAINAAGHGGVIEVPPAKTCNVSSITLSVTGGLIIRSGGYTESSAGGIQFTGTPGACSNQSGGLLLISGNSANVTIRDIKLYEQNAGASTNCFINISTSARIKFDNVQFSGPAGAATQALFLSQIAQISIEHSYFYDGVFSQWIVEDTASGNYLNNTIISKNRFGPLVFAQAYHYGLDFNSTQTAGTQNLLVENNVLEQDPNLIRAALCFGCSIMSNWAADAFPVQTWNNGGGSGASFLANSCVIPTTYNTKPFLFCTSTAGTGGASEPTWNTNPGQTTTDGTVTWTNEGAGIGADLTGTGAFSRNNWQSGGAIGLKTESASTSGWQIASNYFAGAIYNYILNNAQGSVISSNQFVDTVVHPLVNETGSGFLIVGDGSTTVKNVNVGPNTYTSGSGNGVPWLQLSANTKGSAFFDSTVFSSARFTDSSSNGWIITDPAGLLSKAIAQTFSEGGGPSCSGAGVDCIYGDSTAHALKASYNNAAFLRIPQVLGTGAVALGTSAIASTACSTAATASVTGVTAASVIHWSFASTPAAVTGYGGANNGAVVQVYAYATSGTVNFIQCNNTAGSITPSAMSVNYEVIQ